MRISEQIKGLLSVQCAWKIMYMKHNRQFFTEKSNALFGVVFVGMRCHSYFSVTPAKRQAMQTTDCRTVQTVQTECFLSDTSIRIYFVIHLCVSSYKIVLDMSEWLFIFIDRPHNLIAWLLIQWQLWCCTTKTQEGSDSRKYVCVRRLNVGQNNIKRICWIGFLWGILFSTQCAQIKLLM